MYNDEDFTIKLGAELKDDSIKNLLEGIKRAKKKVEDSQETQIDFTLDSFKIKESGDILSSYVGGTSLKVKTLDKSLKEVIVDVKGIESAWNKLMVSRVEGDKEFNLLEQAGMITNTQKEEYKNANSEMVQYLNKLAEAKRDYLDKLSQMEGTEEKNLGDLVKTYEEAYSDATYAVENFQMTLEKIKGKSSSFDELKETLMKATNLNLDEGFKKIDENGNITKYKNDLGDIVTVTKELNALQNPEYTYALSRSYGTIDDSINKLQRDVDKMTSSLSGLKRTKEVLHFEELKTQFDATQKSIESLRLSLNTASTKEATEISKQIGVLINKQKELASSMQITTDHVKNQGGWMLNLRDSFQKAFTSFTTYISVTTVFFQALHAVKSMISEVKDLDDALVELQKVTDLEGSSLKQFTEDAYEAGKSVAKTGTEMVEAATQFAKAGYDEKQVLELGRVASMYTNIADEEISAADAAEFIIAQLKAFNMEAEDSIHVIDAVNEVSNRYAVSSADLIFE